MPTRSERRRAQIVARKAATKARLAELATPPTEPVAMPWRRRGPTSMRRSPDAVWSTVVEGDASGTIAVALATVARFVRELK